MMRTGTGKVALVTGGGTGVGRAAVLQFARRGYAVAVNYSRSREDAEQTVRDAQALGVAAVAMAANVARDDEVRALIEQCRSTWGRLDVVVNNAGTTHFIDHTNLEAVTDQVWEDILSVNLKGPFQVCRAAIPLLRESGGGAIVNVASVAGVSGAGSSIPYAASKGALITLTKSLAKAFAPDIRVNAVCPGVIISRWLADHQEMIEAALKVTPLGKASSTDDIADVITFLACDAQNMTGQALVIDGGRTI